MKKKYLNKRKVNSNIKKGGQMEDIYAFAIPAIISSGILAFNQAMVEFLIYGFVIILIVYNVFVRFLKKYRLDIFIKTISASIMAFVGILYISKEGAFFVLLGFGYIIFTLFLMTESLKKYTGVVSDIP